MFVFRWNKNFTVLGTENSEKYLVELDRPLELSLSSPTLCAPAKPASNSHISLVI